MGINIGVGIGSAGIGSAGIGTSGISIDPSPAPPSYEGPLDLVPGAAFAWSQQALSASFTDPAIRLILDDVGDSEQDFAPTDDHSVSIAAVNTFKGANNAFHKVNYDQTGNDYDVTDFFTAQETNKPGWAVSAGSPLPTLGPRAGIPAVGNFPLGRDSAPNLSGGATIFLVVYNPGLSGGSANPIQAYETDFGSEYWMIGVQDDLLRFQVGDSNNWDAFVDTTGFHLYEWTIDAAGQPAMWKDGVSIEVFLMSGSLTPIPSAATAILEYEVRSPTDGAAVTLGLYAGLCWPGALSAPNRLLIRQNMQSIFGTPALP